MRASIGPAPSSLTASAAASLRNRPAARRASSSLTWYDMNGRSATTSGRRQARVTAAVSMSISSIVAGHRRGVAEHDHRRRVADQHEVDAGALGDTPGRVVVGGDHHERAAVALGLPSSCRGSLRVGVRSRTAGWSCVLQGHGCRSGASCRRRRRRAGLRDGTGRTGRGRRAAAARGSRARRRGAERAASHRRVGVALAAGVELPGGRQRRRAATSRARARPRTRKRLRDESARPSASRTVGTPTTSTPSARSRATPRTITSCWKSFSPKNAWLRPHQAEEARHDGGDAAEVAGARAALELVAERARDRPSSRSPAG